MAIRNDITVTTSSTPRTINIAAPSDTVTIRDLLDTLASIASSVTPKLFDAVHTAGGFFGPTIMLYDAQVAFEGHIVFKGCSITDGVLLGDRPDLIAITPNTQVTIVQTVNALSGGDELTVERFLQLQELLGDAFPSGDLPDNLYIANNGDPYIAANGDYYIGQ